MSEVAAAEWLLLSSRNRARKCTCEILAREWAHVLYCHPMTLWRVGVGHSHSEIEHASLPLEEIHAYARGQFVPQI